MELKTRTDLTLTLTTQNIGYEGCDSWLQVTKCMGKTVTTKEIISGDFLIAEATVDNCSSSTATTIFTRD